FGAAGMGSPDDTEMFERMQAGFAATVAPWVLLARGINRQRQDLDGTIVSHVMDEVTQRAIWRHWKRMMMAEDRPAPARRDHRIEPPHPSALT
ncbi:MAG TPA: hypothetical protein VMD75_04310, partial [Candidatus Binataceae bacterium]|nr:hypothetical protein [Candidatus Binataceae bacterium]